jgi:hypothetical protein
MADPAPWANDIPVDDSTQAAPWANDIVVDDGAPKKTSVAQGTQAAASGLWSGAADVVGLPVDTARNVIELGKAGAGFVYHEATGNDIPSALQPNDSREQDVLGSEWLKEKVRNLGAGNFVDSSTDTPLARYLHAAGESAAAGALTSGEATLPAIARVAIGGAGGGVAQQAAADAGYGTVGQTIAGLAGGIGASEAPRAASAVKTAVGRAGSAVADATGRVVDAIRPSDAAAQAAADTKRQSLGYDDSTAATSPAPAGFTPEALEVQAAAPGAQPTKADPWAGDRVVPAEPTDFAPPHNDGEERTAVPDLEQAQRASTLRQIGLNEARSSAITGDSSATGADFQASKLDNAAGKRMASVIDNENNALRNYSEQRVAESAGSQGDDQAARYNRGAAIVAPVEQLSDYFDRGVRQLYKAADDKAGQTPFAASSLNQAVANRSAFLGTVEGKQLLEGVQARMQDLGLRSTDGMAQPATVQQAERLRQYLGDQWTPRTSRLIGTLKDSLDDDVAKAAGGDVYQQARSLRATRAATLDDPTGIAKLAEPDDRTGINRAVALEKVPEYVANLPVQQFRHLVSTLKSVPAEVRPAAAAALNEIRAHFANRVDTMGKSTQGMWNAKGVNKYLRDNTLRMREVFTPEEMGRYQTLNEAGRVLKMDRTYPGAEAQRYNLAAKGLNAIGQGAPALGSHLGGVAGYAAGHAIGSVVGKGAEKLVLRDVEKRIRKL